MKRDLTHRRMGRCEKNSEIFREKAELCSRSKARFCEGWPICGELHNMRLRGNQRVWALRGPATWQATPRQTTPSLERLSGAASRRVFPERCAGC